MNKYSSFPSNKGQVPPDMVDRNCNWNLGLWLLIHDTRPQQQSLQEKQSSLEAHLLWWHLISRPSRWKRRKSSLKATPFNTPSPQRQKMCPSRWTPATWMPDPGYLMNLTHIKHPLHHLHYHPSGYTHPGCHHIHPLHLYHQENHQLSLAFRGLLTYRQEETPVWTSLHQTPQDWQRTHTQTFSSIAGNVTPGHHTNWRDQPKQELDRLSAQCIELLSRSSQRKIGNWCILTHFKTLTHTAKFDSFQDHHSGQYSKSSEIYSFQDPCELQSNWLISEPYVHMWAQNLFVLTPFKTPVNLSSNWLLSRPNVYMQHKKLSNLTPFKTLTLDYKVFLFPMAETLQSDSVKSPWETTLRKLVLSGPPIHSEFQTHFKTPVNHTSHSVNGLLSRPFRRGKEQHSTL